MEQTECSERLAVKLHTPVNHPEESIQQKDELLSLSKLKNTNVCFHVLLGDGFFSTATTCPLWTSWSPLPVVAEV
jgi:hypothetical protein